MNRTAYRVVVAVWIASFLFGTTAAQEFRTLDGSGNNLLTPTLGSAGNTLKRMTTANYADGVATVPSNLPNARTVSNSIFTQAASVPDPQGLSEWTWLWGQFVDHDLDHTLASPTAGSLQIPIPAGDPVFGGLPPGSAIQMSRAVTVAGTGVATPVPQPREHANNISAWLDAGMVYGHRAVDGPVGVVRSEWLRDPLDTAKLRTSDGGALGPLLPKFQLGTSPVMANTVTPGMTQSIEGDLAYVAGDVRANENTALLVLHTVFLREHNRLVDLLRDANPALDNQQLYDRARKLVGAEVQAITYHEFLPAMGVDLDAYAGYDDTADPTIYTEFSNAAFRVAHSQINAVQLRLDSHGQVIPAGNLNLADSFFNPSTLLESGLEPLIRGLTAQVQEANDALMVDPLRNQLFSIFIPEFGLVDSATDLAGIDIQRGRDVGLGSLNDIRSSLGLAPYASFQDLTSDSTQAATLASLYGTVDDVDLFVGLLTEEYAPGASLGPTTLAIYQKQFELLRDGDRFWFEIDPMGVNSDLEFVATWDGTTSQSARDWLADLKLSHLLLRNTNLDSLPENVFFAQPVPEPSGLVLLIGCVAMLPVRRRRRTG